MIANFLTCMRILCAAGLLFCPAFSTNFFLLYLIGGVSDVLDGYAARKSGTVSEFGTKLDTAADAIFLTVSLVRILTAVKPPAWLVVWICVIAVYKCVNTIRGFLRHGHFITAHTVINKICGALVFAFPFLIGILSRIIVLAILVFLCTLTTFAAFAEGKLIRAGKQIN